jgi:hypothetical protein
MVVRRIAKAEAAFVGPENAGMEEDDHPDSLRVVPPLPVEHGNVDAGDGQRAGPEISVEPPRVGPEGLEAALPQLRPREQAVLDDPLQIPDVGEVCKPGDAAGRRPVSNLVPVIHAASLPVAHVYAPLRNQFESIS